MATDACSNPGDALFDAGAEVCMNCIINGPLFKDGLCPWFSNVGSCLNSAGCGGGAFDPRFDEIVDVFLNVAVPGCAECNLGAAYNCLDAVLAVPINAVNCDLRRALAVQCFATEGCSVPTQNAAISLTPAFNQCSGGTALDLAQCAVGRIVLPFTDPILRIERLGDGICDPEYNVPECQFDNGDCCIAPGGVCIENGGNGNFAQADTCMRCLSQAPFDPLRPETICGFVQGAVDCILVNNCPPLHPIFGAVLQEVAFFGDLCNDAQCDQGLALQCVEALQANTTNGTDTNQTSSGVDCSAISVVTQCLDNAGCSKDIVLNSIGVGDSSSSIVQDCFGCSPQLGVEIEILGERKCGEITIQAKLNISDQCVAAINGIFDSPDFSQFFIYDWEVDIAARRRMLPPGSGVIPLPFFSGQNRVILPAAELPPVLLEVNVNVEAAVFPDIKGSAVVNFDPSSLILEPIIPKTSGKSRSFPTTCSSCSPLAYSIEFGSLTLYSGLANGAALYQITAYQSCNPNVVGCQFCTRTAGYVGFLDTGLPEPVIKEITGFEGPTLPTYDFQWTVTCQNPPCSLAPQAGYVFPIDEALLNPANSPYIITLTIVEGGGAATYKATPITLTVLDGAGIPPGCEIPIVNIITPQAQLALDITTQEQNLAINEEIPEVVLFAELTRQDGSFIQDPFAEGIILEWYLGPVLIQVGEVLVVDEALLTNFEDLTFTLVAVNPCTGGNDPSKELVFKSNKPPENGTLVVSPTTGDFRTLFRLSTSGWQDAENNLPFSYIYFVEEVVITPPLGPTAEQFLFGIGSVNVRVVAQDSLGALSRPAEFSVTMQQLEATDVDDNYFEDLTGRGTGETELLGAVLGITELINGDTGNANSEKSRLLRKKCLEVVRSAGAALRAQNDSSVENLVVQADAIGRVCENPDELGDSDFGEIATFFKDLLGEVKNTDLATQTTVDPVFRDVLRGASLLLDSLVRNGLARRLQNGLNESTCSDVANIRDVVTELGLIRAKDDFPGSFVRTIDSPSVHVLASNTRSNQAAGSYSIGNVTVNLPANLSSDSSTITTLISQYDFNVRVCDDADTNFLGTVASEDECDDLNTDVPINFDGPLQPVDNVVSIEFRNTLGNGGSTAFEPSNLDAPIVLNIPMGDLGDQDLGLCSNFTKLSCGFYSQSDSGFRTEGCSVTSVDYDARTLECTCNHASDYAAWLAFEEDVRNVFSKPLTIVTLFAVLLSSGVLGLIFVAYCLCLVWGDRRDRKTARVLQKEAVGIMVLNNFLLKQRQRQFFENLRVAVEKGKGEREEVEEEAEEDGEESGGLCSRVCLALRYEHSLLGLVRFDPHYSRVQRVSVFIAVVVGNLFVAALAFELKDSEIDDLSPGFVVVVVLISSLLVAIPIRFVIKMLFRITEFQKGSESERVAQLYRISKQAEENFEGVSNNRNDLALVYAYKELYIAQEHLKSLEAEAGKSSGCCSCCSRGSTKTEALTQPVGAPVVEDEEEDFSESLSNLNKEKGRSVDEELMIAEQEVGAAKRRLKETIQRAKEDWQKTSKKEAIKRVKLVTKQKSTFMKAIALVADEAAPLAKPRRGLCPHFFVYVSWVVLLGLYGLSVFYIVRFILTRADRAALPTVNRTEEELISVWLTTSAIGILIGYCLAEPLIAIIRYAVLPYCVLKCGSKADDDDDEVDVIEEDEEAAFNESLKQLEGDGDGEKAKGGRRGQGGRGQYFLEFISDLIETIY